MREVQRREQGRFVASIQHRHKAASALVVEIRR
jgi:hypothetical protein